MAQSLEVNIKTTSDVPQAMDKAKAATSGFQNQLNDIGKKFSNSFKDIALGFIAPMILVQSAISFISAAIAKAKQDAKDAYDFAVKGESKYLDQTTITLAQRRRTREEDAKDREMAKKAKEGEAEEFLKQEGMRDRVADEIGGFRGFRLKYGLDANSASAMSKDKDVQDAIARIVNPNGDGKKPPEAAAPKAVEIKADAALGSGVIGVGASAQILLAQEANATLASMDAKLGLLVNEGIDKDPTKPLGRKYPLYSPGMSR